MVSSINQSALRGVQILEATHAYPRMRCLTLASAAISRPSSGVQKDSRPHMAQVYIEATAQAEPRLRWQHFIPYSARQLHHCLQWDCLPASLPNRAALSFRQAASELCVLAALPAHTTLVCSSLLLLQLLVTYALVRRKASSGMRRTCSDRASQSLGPI